MLQLLEDLGYASSSERDGKKVYTITDAGKQYLNESEVTIGRIKAHMKDKFSKSGSEELREALHAFRDLHHSIGKRVHRIDSEKLARIRVIISKACLDIEDVIEK
jgi:DNA-binding PadR family transcriptional regulator